MHTDAVTNADRELYSIAVGFGDAVRLGHAVFHGIPEPDAVSQLDAIPEPDAVSQRDPHAVADAEPVVDPDAESLRNRDPQQHGLRFAECHAIRVAVVVSEPYCIAVCLGNLFSYPDPESLADANSVTKRLFHAESHCNGFSDDNAIGQRDSVGVVDAFCVGDAKYVSDAVSVVDALANTDPDTDADRERLADPKRQSDGFSE